MHGGGVRVRGECAVSQGFTLDAKTILSKIDFSITIF